MELPKAQMGVIDQLCDYVPETGNVPRDLPLEVRIALNTARVCGVVPAMRQFGDKDFSITVYAPRGHSDALFAAGFLKGADEEGYPVAPNTWFHWETPDMPRLDCAGCGEDLVTDALDSLAAPSLEGLREALLTHNYCGYCQHMTDKDD